MSHWREPLPLRDVGLEFEIEEERVGTEIEAQAKRHATEKLERLGAVEIWCSEGEIRELWLKRRTVIFYAYGEVPVTDGALRYVDAEFGRDAYFDARNQGVYYPSPSA